MTWYRPAGSLRQGDADVVITPDTAPWTYSGLRVWTLSPGRVVSITLSEDEGVLVPLSARDIDAGDMLLSCVADDGADLLVMGAYGQPRFRELVLG